MTAAMLNSQREHASLIDGLEQLANGARQGKSKTCRRLQAHALLRSATGRFMLSLPWLLSHMLVGGIPLQAHALLRRALGWDEERLKHEHWAPHHTKAAEQLYRQAPRCCCCRSVHSAGGSTQHGCRRLECSLRWLKPLQSGAVGWVSMDCCLYPRRHLVSSLSMCAIFCSLCVDLRGFYLKVRCAR
jgi:hypothetical protein